ncbi:hypothetical protein HOP50_16g77990 [Chloropicon primus]|uniref:Uncharacterized protein n=2 Tax=Chloropicon primus TaxID=1764295 RepID=A0A5B8MXE8_9CHLO|nr:hypothetical protein A3770_16p77710 [Chloropicon primus]UPR04458.1 hypothetical protein HOP50_16g77990 [Chloropicon primus]|eukprot:QDZ25253.1 hypothetical protein A3770_16p77710 [Chloropicon primus]
MVDLSTTISSFESEVNKALRVLARKLKEQSKATAGSAKNETTDKDHKYQCEKKLKEVFDYYKAKVPLDVLSHKLLEFGKKIDHAQLFTLSTQECYDTILDASSGNQQQLPFHITATAFYRKAVCDCEVLVEKTRGLRSGKSVELLTSILDCVQRFMASSIENEDHLWSVFNGTTVLYEIARAGSSKGLGHIVRPYLIFALECLDCIELLYIPKHVGWYVQLCIAVAECSDTTSENEEENQKNIKFAQIFLNKARDQGQRMKTLASMDTVQMEPELVKLIDRANFRLSLFFPKYEMLSPSGGGDGLDMLEETFPQVGDRMLALLLALQRPNKRIVVHHYTPQDDSKERKLLDKLSQTFESYLEVTTSDTLRFRDIFTNLDLELSQGYTADGKEVHPRKFSRHATLADMLVSLSRTFYLYEQWEEFDKVCDHINAITASLDGQTVDFGSPLGMEGTEREEKGEEEGKKEGQGEGQEEGEKKKKINPKVILDGLLASNTRSTAMVIKCCKAVETENGSIKSIKELSSALKQDSKYEDVDLAIDVSLLLCKYSQIIIGDACKEVDRMAANTYKLYKQKKRRGHKSSLKASSTSPQQSLSPQQSVYDSEEYNVEIISVAKQALFCVDKAFRETDFDDTSLRLRTAIQLGIITERLLHAGTYGYAEADVGDWEQAIEALTACVEAADVFRSEAMISSIDNSDPEPIESVVACLQVDAISLQFRIQLTAAQYRDKTDKQNQPVTHLRMMENKIANSCSKNVYWLSLFYMQYACVHSDRSKIPAFMLESLRHLQDLSGRNKGDAKQADSSSGPAFAKGDELVLPPPELVMITSREAVVTFSKPAKGPNLLKAIKYFSIDAKASSGTSVRAMGRKENELIPIGEPFRVKGLQSNQSYVFIASCYDGEGKKVAISMPTQASCACNPLSTELLWCYAAITCARLANDLSLPMHRKLPSLSSVVSTAKGSSSLIKLLKIACKHVKEVFRADMRDSGTDFILNPVDTVQMNNKKVPLMAQSMLRSLALVMFCESDMLHHHNPIGEEKSSKLLLDIQVKTMMQAKHALMAFELGCLINDRELCLESLVRTNNIMVRLIRCRTRSPYLIKLVSSLVILLSSHFNDGNKVTNTDEAQKVCTYISALLVCEVERIYKQCGEHKAGSQLMDITLQLIKMLCKNLEHADYQVYGAKKALNVLQLKGVGDFVNGSISDEIPIPIVSLAKQVLHEKKEKGPDGIPDLISSAIEGGSSENSDETLHVMIYVLSILLKDRNGTKFPLASKVAESAPQIVEALEQKAKTMLEGHYTRLSDNEAEKGGDEVAAEGEGEGDKPGPEEKARAQGEKRISSMLMRVLRRRSELRKARSDFLSQCQLYSRVVLLVSEASEYTHDKNIADQAAEAEEKNGNNHKKVMEVLHLSCIAVEMTSRFNLRNLFRAACVQAWNCCCKFNLFDQVDSLPDGLKDDLLVICNRLMDFVFDFNVQGSEYFRGQEAHGTDNVYFQHQRNVAASFEGPNNPQDLEWLAKMQDAAFVALLRSQGTSRTKDVLRLGAEYISDDREKRISAYSLKSVLQHLVSIISNHGELIPGTPDYNEKLYKMEKTSSVCFNSLESCRDLAFRGNLMLTYEEADVSTNMSKAIKEYSSCIPLLRQMDEIDLMMEALQEMADLAISVGNEKTAKRTLNELLDSIFGEFQTIMNWRNKFFQNKDNAGGSSSAEWLIRQIGEKQGILAISVLGKLLNLSNKNDIYITGECAMLAALVSRAILASTLRHPSYLCNFARYTAPRKLSEKIDLIHMPRFASIVDLLLGLESIASTLLNRKAFLEALPVLVLADHCIIQYSMSEQAKVKRSEKDDAAPAEEGEEVEEGEEAQGKPDEPQNRPLIWREGMIMHFRAQRVRACIELGFFNAAHALLFPILKASESLESLDLLTEEWLFSDHNNLGLSDGGQFNPCKAVAAKENAKALQDIASIKIGSAFRERFGIAAEMEIAACQSLFLINIASCINFPIGENSTPDTTYVLDETCSMPKLMEAAQNVIESILNEDSTQTEPSKRIFDTEGRLVLKCQMLLQYANMKRALCESKVAIELVKKAGSTLQSIKDAAASPPKDPGYESRLGWLPMKNDLTMEIWLESMVILMQCYADLGNLDEALSLCQVLSMEAFNMKAYNVLVHMEHIKASLNLGKGDSEATIQGYKTAIMLVEKNKGCITPEQHAVLISDYAVALEALEGDLRGAREQLGWAAKVFESQSNAQGFSIGLQHKDRTNLFCRSTPLYLNAMMNLGRIDVLLAQSGTVDSKLYAKQALETFGECHNKARYCALDAHIQASMHTYTGCASAILNDFQIALSYFERAFSWFTTGDFSDPGLLRILMLQSAQATYDHFHDEENFFALLQYATKVSKVFAASRAPEHYGVHISDKGELPKAINMHMDRYGMDSEHLSEVNKDKRAAAMYASRVLQAAMFSVPSMLPMSFTVVKRWNVLGSIVATDGLNMSGGQFDLSNDKEVATVRSLILGGSQAQSAEAPDIPTPKPGSICLQYFGINASSVQSPEQQESSKGRPRNLLLFYAVLPSPDEPEAAEASSAEGGDGQHKPGWRCGYGHVDWHKLRALKDVLVSEGGGLDEEEEEAQEAVLQRLQRVLQAFAKVLLYVGSDKEPDKSEPSQRKVISELSRVDAQEGLGKPQVVSIFNQLKAMLDASVGVDIVHSWLAGWLCRVLEATENRLGRRLSS